MKKKEVLECLVKSEKSSLEATEIVEFTKLSLFEVIQSIDGIVRDGFAINGGSRDGAAIIANSKSKPAYEAGYYN